MEKNPMTKTKRSKTPNPTPSLIPIFMFFNIPFPSLFFYWKFLFVDALLFIPCNMNLSLLPHALGAPLPAPRLPACAKASADRRQTGGRQAAGRLEP
jgi:hypothetical protein